MLLNATCIPAEGTIANVACIWAKICVFACMAPMWMKNVRNKKHTHTHTHAHTRTHTHTHMHIPLTPTSLLLTSARRCEKSASHSPATHTQRDARQYARGCERADAMPWCMSCHRLPRSRQMGGHQCSRRGRRRPRLGRHPWHPWPLRLRGREMRSGAWRGSCAWWGCCICG